MATDDRPATGSLIELLEREAYRFDFYQAVRLVEALRPDAVPPGHGGSHPEPVAFCSRVALEFPASDLVSAEIPADPSEPVRLTVAFMGLAGASGPLPTPFTELVIQRSAARDHASRDFLDIFNHRLVSFLYRSRKKHRPGLDSRSPEHTPAARWLFGLGGLEYPARRTQSRKWTRALLKYSGILAHQVRSMSALEAMLSDRFATPVTGEQMLGRWLRIDARDWTRIGRQRGVNQRLGVDAVLGKRAWNQGGRIRLHLKALELERLREFLPGRSALQALEQMVRVHLQQDIDVALTLSLAAGQRAGTRLARSGGHALGWTAWLSTGRSRASDDPARVALPALAEGWPGRLRTA
jgi:type VI secretion system protein ImpH